MFTEGGEGYAGVEGICLSPSGQLLGAWVQSPAMLYPSSAQPGSGCLPPSLHRRSVLTSLRWGVKLSQLHFCGQLWANDCGFRIPPSGNENEGCLAESP